MACDPLSYSAVDAAKWACAKDVVRREYGITIDREEGEATKRSFTLQWRYDPSAQTLEVRCSKKPLLVPCRMVNQRINDAAAKCGVVAVRGELTTQRDAEP